jgi:hypothetical protein
MSISSGSSSSIGGSSRRILHSDVLYLASMNIFDFILFKVRKALPSTVSDRSGIILYRTHGDIENQRMRKRERMSKWLVEWM